MTAMRLATGVAPAVAFLLLLGSMWIETASAEEAENGGVQEVKSPQYAPDETVDLARRLIVAGNPETAYRLLRRAMQAAADDVDTTAIRYMAAQALLAGGHYAQAAQLLGRFAEDRPDLDLVRLEYAATLFALGRDDKAGEIFRDIRRKKDLPPPVQRNVDGFLERIRARQRWRLDFDMGFWRDDNVNNAPESETVAIPAFGGFRFTLDQKPVRAWIARTGVHLRWREPVTKSGSLYFETHASVSRNTAIGASAYNRTWANVSTGPRVRYTVGIAGRPRPGLFYADLGVERRWRGGGGYATSPWAGLGMEQVIARNWRVGAFPRVWVKRYDGEANDADSWGRSLALNVARRVGPGWLTASGKISRETPERRNLRWTSREVSLRFAADIGRNWSMSVRAGLTRTRFEAEESLFLKRREDRTHDVGLTVSHRALVWEGYLPELALNWSRTTSSIPLYERELRTVRLGLRRLF